MPKLQNWVSLPISSFYKIQKMFNLIIYKKGTTWDSKKKVSKIKP